MLANTFLARGGTWPVGSSTVVAAAIVMVVTLVGSRPRDDQQR